jgi:hypothetical protein
LKPSEVLRKARERLAVPGVLADTRADCGRNGRLCPACACEFSYDALDYIRRALDTRCVTAWMYDADPRSLPDVLAALDGAILIAEHEEAREVA